MQRRGLPIGGRDVTLIQALQLTAALAPCSHPHAPHTSFPAQPRGGGSHTVPDPTQAAQTYGCVGSCGLVGRWALAASLLGSDTWLSKPHPGLTCLLQRRSVCWPGKPAAGNGPLWPSPGWGFPLEDPQGSHTPNCCSRVAPMGDPTERRVRSAGHRAALLSCSHSWPGATRLLSCRCTSAWQSWRHRDPPFPPVFLHAQSVGQRRAQPGQMCPIPGLCPPHLLHSAKARSHSPYAAAVLPTFSRALLLISGMLPAEEGPGPLSHELQDAAQPFSLQPRPRTGRNRGSVLPAWVGGSGKRGPGLPWGVP